MQHSSAQAKPNFNVPFKYTAFNRYQEAILKAASKDCAVIHNLLLLKTTVKEEVAQI